MKTLAEHILDISQNATRAGAGRIEIGWMEKTEEDLLQLSIEDNGKGMSAEMLQRVTHPYTTSRSSRKVGMGLSLLRQNAEQTGGSVHIASEEGKGTAVTARFGLSHLDLPGRGDVAGVIVMLMYGNPGVDIVLQMEKDGESYTVSSREIKEALGIDEIKGSELIKGITGLLSENIREVWRK